MIRLKEAWEMTWHREERKDLFWSGFLAGAILGGAVGVLLLSESGRRARKQLELAADQVRGRFNGRPDARGPAPQEPEAPESTEEPASEEKAEDPAS